MTRYVSRITKEWLRSIRWGGWNDRSIAGWVDAPRDGAWWTVHLEPDHPIATVTNHRDTTRCIKSTAPCRVSFSPSAKSS